MILFVNSLLLLTDFVKEALQSLNQQTQHSFKA
jgi:hypothetical protein